MEQKAKKFTQRAAIVVAVQAFPAAAEAAVRVAIGAIVTARTAVVALAVTVVAKLKIHLHRQIETIEGQAVSAVHLQGGREMTSELSAMEVAAGVATEAATGIIIGGATPAPLKAPPSQLTKKEMAMRSKMSRRRRRKAPRKVPTELWYAAEVAPYGA